MNAALLILIVLAVLVLLFSLLMRFRKKPAVVLPMPAEWKAILQKDVPFYSKLEEKRKPEFEHRMMHFLSTSRLTGVNTELEDLDRIYIAASAIIPIFGFKDWEYINLHEVLVYPGSFNHDFEQTGASRTVLGMVGDGAMNNMMVISQHELRQAFINKSGKSNTAIHEFVHLVDKTDGSVDGIPEFLLDKQYVLPWLQLVQQNIREIINDRSDIDPYAISNNAEFFAVVSEYFFERPDLLQTRHPALYELLSKIFRQEAGNNR